VISGGSRNVIDVNAYDSVVAGGVNHHMEGVGGSIGGGISNRIARSAFAATISGGRSNNVTGDFATIPGGQENTAANYAFAAGYRAKAEHRGSFVWADASSQFPVYSTAENQISMRAVGGIGLFTSYSSIDATTGRWILGGAVLAPGSGSWAQQSARESKENFQDVDGHIVLEGIGGLPINTWNYRAQDESIRHLGPTAQDFYTAFGLGHSDEFIHSIDAEGVALAGIKELYKLLKEQQQQIEKLQIKLSALTAAFRTQQDLAEASTPAAPASTGAPVNISDETRPDQSPIPHSGRESDL
jgi:hypothetical protein